MHSINGKIIEDHVVGFFIVEVEVILFAEVDMSTEAAGPVSLARFAWTDEEEGFGSGLPVLFRIKEGIENLLVNLAI